MNRYQRYLYEDVPKKRAIALVITSAWENGQTCALMEWRTDQPFRSTWSFPGGKIEPGETASVTLGREAHEELGITIHGAWPLKKISAPSDWTLYPYLVTDYTGILPRVILDSGHPLLWLALDPARPLAWKPAQLIAEQVDKILKAGLDRASP